MSHCSLKDRRETCLWLAELATWRPGVAAKLVRRYESFAEVLLRPRNELAVALGAGRASGAGKSGASDRSRAGPGLPGSSPHAEDGSEGGAWRAALARLGPGPAAQPPAAGVVVAFTDPQYPAGLHDLPDPPPALFVLGGANEPTARERLATLAELVPIAVVGTRRPSSYGLDMARAISRDLVVEGAAVVSGLALGIDAAAHRGALEAAGTVGPRTIAVMAGGADVCYPPSHRALREQVLAQGLIVSEFVWGVSARAWRFPARNRVMAALSAAAIVVEGARNSGAMITARRAQELDRLLLAVPGECGRRLTEGPHELLRAGASLCECGACVGRAFRHAAEVDGAVLRQNVVRWLGERAMRSQPIANGAASEVLAGREAEPLTAAARRVLATVDAGPRDLDGVIAISGLPSAAALAALGALEVAGLVRVQSGGSYRAVRGSPVGSRSD